MSRLQAGLLTLVVGLWCSAAPAAFAGFVEEPISFQTHDGLTLEGILSHPDTGDGPFPGMLMIAGSGLNDADGTINAPFFDLTDGRQRIYRGIARTFSKRGYAVLRYNKRGAAPRNIGSDPDILRNSTIGDIIEDARNALGALVAHPGVAATPLLIVGHSEGSYVATRLARDSGLVDLLILVGSVASPFEETMMYQAHGRYMDFYARAVDADADGYLTLDEFAALDDNFGLGSFWVYTNVELLFGLPPNPIGAVRVDRLNPDVDLDGDGRFDLDRELGPANRAQAELFIDGLKSGANGVYMQSYFSLKPNVGQIRKTGAKILFVQGDADVQTPVSETLALIERLEKRPARPYDLLLLEGLGHTLSPPNDYFKGDGGLTVLDNLTQNAPSKKVIRSIARRARQLLRRDR